MSSYRLQIHGVIGEMDIDDDADQIKLELKSRYGERLLHGFMTCLADQSLWLEEAPCVQKHVPAQQLGSRKAVPKTKSSKQLNDCKCPTPYGFCSRNRGVGERCLYVASAGTTCVDVSRFGAMAGLMGNSCEALSIWLSELALTRPVTCLEYCQQYPRSPRSCFKQSS